VCSVCSKGEMVCTMPDIHRPPQYHINAVQYTDSSWMKKELSKAVAEESLEGWFMVHNDL
jgi:hypothetical protein